jgi:hypothetical protein
MGIHRKRVTSSKYDCIYDGERLKDMAVRALLENAAEKLLAESVTVGEGPVGLLQQIEIDGESFFARCYSAQPFHRNGFFRPFVWQRFVLLETLVAAGVPTPAPLLAAAMSQGPFRQIFVGDYCAESATLKHAVATGNAQMRSALMQAYAQAIIQIYCCGFSSRGLRSTDFLVPAEETRVWLARPRHIYRPLVRTRQAFYEIIAHSCAGFYDLLSADERNLLFSLVFDRALKMNIFRRPSQRDAFIKTLIGRLRGCV